MHPTYPSPANGSYLLPATLRHLANALVYLYHNNYIALQWKLCFCLQLYPAFLSTPELLGKFVID